MQGIFLLVFYYNVKFPYLERLVDVDAQSRKSSPLDEVLEGLDVGEKVITSGQVNFGDKEVSVF